jgi:hypothetical protein
MYTNFIAALFIIAKIEKAQMSISSFYSAKKRSEELGTVVHACDPSILGGWEEGCIL